MTRGPLTLARVEDESGAAALVPEWRALYERCGHARVFQGPDWCLAWWRSVAAGSGRHRLALATIRDAAGELVGLAPLMIETEGGRRVLRFLAHPYTDYHDVLYPATHRQAVLATLWQGLTREWEGWDRLALTEMPAGSPTTAWLADLAGRYEPLEVTPASVCPAIDLTDEAAVKRAAGKYEYRAKARKLAESGPLTCEHLRGADAIRRHLPAFREMHLTQWSRREGVVGGFGDASVTAFFTALVDALGPDGTLVLTVLSVKGTAVAYYLGMADRGTYRAYRTTFDTSLARYSPGGVMLRQMVLDFRAEGYTRFDFMRGDYDYKHRFASDLAQNSTFALSRSSLTDQVRHG